MFQQSTVPSLELLLLWMLEYLNSVIDVEQIEGTFTQGLELFTME